MDNLGPVPKSATGKDMILIAIDRLTKMARFIPTYSSITSKGTADLFLREVFRHHGLPSNIVSDRDPRFTAKFWEALQKAFGLSIADGLQANISALTQSAQNVTDGVGMLQTADGALSQVTTLLNRAVTLATEAANAGLTGPTSSNALQNEFASITNEINQIGIEHHLQQHPGLLGNPLSVFLSDGSQTDDAMTPTLRSTCPRCRATRWAWAPYATGTLDLTANPGGRRHRDHRYPHLHVCGRGRRRERQRCGDRHQRAGYPGEPGSRGGGTPLRPTEPHRNGHRGQSLATDCVVGGSALIQATTPGTGW